jgi:pimeloyl-ACP methyl ester carboxylesterase
MVASLKPWSKHATRFAHLSSDYTAEYIDCGKGRPIVLVPGLAGGIGLLEPLIDELAKSHRVIAYELRGEGPSLFQRDYHFNRLVQDLGELINQLRLERPGVVGVSFGAAIAVEFATRHSRRLSFLAAQGASKVYHPGLFGDVARQVLDNLALPENSPFVNQFFSLLIGSRRREGDQFDFIVRRSWDTDQSVMAHRMALLDEYDPQDRLSQIHTPSLILAGEQDVLVPMGESRELASLIPSAEFRSIDRAGHLAFVTHARRLGREIQEFAGNYQMV